MAASAADPIEELSTFRARWCDPVGRRLEVIQQVELEIIDKSARNLVGDTIGIEVFVGARCRGRFQPIVPAVEHHARRCDEAPARFGRRELRIDGLQAHFVVQRSVNELADRDLAAVREERPNAKVWIDADDSRRVEGSVWQRRQRAIVNALALQGDGDGRFRRLRLRRRLRAQPAEVGRDLVGEHFLQAETEQMRRVPTVGPRCHVATHARRPARPAVASRATVCEPGADRKIHVDVATTIAGQRALPLFLGEFALKELAPATNRAKRIARDDERRRIGRHPVAAVGADLLRERFGDAFVGDVRGFGPVDELGHDSAGK